MESILDAQLRKESARCGNVKEEPSIFFDAQKKYEQEEGGAEEKAGRIQSKRGSAASQREPRSMA